jgi:hypothetical protein
MPALRSACTAATVSAAASPALQLGSPSVAKSTKRPAGLGVMLL